MGIKTIHLVGKLTFQLFYYFNLPTADNKAFIKVFFSFFHSFHDLKQDLKRYIGTTTEEITVISKDSFSDIRRLHGVF